MFSTSQSLPSPSDSGVNEDEGLDKLLWLIIDACEAIQKSFVLHLKVWANRCLFAFRG